MHSYQITERGNNTIIMEKLLKLPLRYLSHESLHLTLNKFSLSASAKLDNLFGRSNTWENYPHGLGDFDRIRHANPTSYKNAQKITKIKAHRRRRIKPLP